MYMYLLQTDWIWIQEKAHFYLEEQTFFSDPAWLQEAESPKEYMPCNRWRKINQVCPLKTPYRPLPSHSSMRVPCPVQSNVNSANTDGSLTMANSNSFLSPYEILPIAQENKQFLWGDSYEYTQHIIIAQKIEKQSPNYRHWLPDLASRLTSVARTTCISNEYPWSQRGSSYWGSTVIETLFMFLTSP